MTAYAPNDFAFIVYSNSLFCANITKFNIGCRARAASSTSSPFITYDEP